MCGILGICGRGDVSFELALGLTTLQHRGQDAAGMATLDGTSFHVEKGPGLVGQVFDARRVKGLKGASGIGHVRYATQGSRDALDAQPLAIDRPLGLAMAHNGNVINFADLRRRHAGQRRAPLSTSADLELIVHSLGAALGPAGGRLGPDEVFEAVSRTQREVLGAYSALALLAGQGFLAFVDPFGLRPLVMGEKQGPAGPSFAFASETACLDCLGYRTLRDLEAGQAVFVDADFRVHQRVCHPPRPAFCVFEYIYFAREDSLLHGRLVASERVRIGRRLARTFQQTGLRPDLVIDVPSSAYFFASALAEELGVPYRRGLSKNPYAGRSFIASTQAERELIVRLKLNAIRDVVRGRKVAVVDDSIVRGTTSRHIVRILRESGATAVYFASAAPPVRHPCIYGIDMSLQREMLAAETGAPEEIARAIGADAVVYQPLAELADLYSGLPCCFACFSGEYPIEGSREFLRDVERERECAKQG